MNRLRLEFAAEGFLAGMRREFMKRHPERPVPMGAQLLDYSPADRSVLMAAVGLAIKNASAEKDEAFQTWCSQRVENVAQ